MIRFLAKRLIADYDNPSSPKVRQAYGILCGAVGICFNLLLFAGKFFAGLISNSIAITADAFNNLSDAGSSVITLIGFHMAGQKPDLQHPFGHGRIEYVSGLVVAGAILIMAFELIKTSLEKIIHPEAVDFQPVSLIILAVSIGVKLYMSSYNRSTGEKIDSAAMKATALDSLSDALSTSVVLVASIIGHFTSLNIDGWCGIAVGLFIFYAGFQAAKDTLNPLLGQAPNPEFIQNIRDITLAHPEILGIHDMLVHDYGPGRQMVSLHCEVSSSGDILLLHDTIDNIERELRSKLHCDAVIHMDPIQDQDEETVKIHHEVLELIHKINPLISIHDFRMVKGNTHTNLIFDVMIPVDYPTPPKVLTKQIELMVQEQHPDFYTVITVDRDYAR
ncbi:MAG: cation transporter [Lachnospiraceae bacterium]|nr:cation transporter [Lachnospiraceae bacterium]